MPRHRMRRLNSSALAVAVLTLTVAFPHDAGAQNPDGSFGGRPAAVTLDTNVILVLPFAVRGPPEAGYLRESMAELLHMALDGVGGIHVVYSDAVQRRLNQLANPTDPAAATAIARSVRAARLVSGSMVVDGTSLQMRVEVFDVERRREQFAVTGRGATSRLTPVVDSIAAAILARRLVPAALRARVRLDDYATSSPRALHAYLAGVQLMARGARREAADSLNVAIAADSFFGPAHLRLQRLEAAQVGSTGMTQPAIRERAWRLRDRFPERIRLLIGLVHKPSADLERRLADANALVARYPNDADVAFLRADLYFHSALNLGRPRERVMEIFRSAFVLVDDDPELLDHYVSLSAETPDTAATWNAVRRCQEASNVCRYDKSFRILYRGEDPWKVAGEPGGGDLPGMPFIRFLADNPGKSVVLADSVEQFLGPRATTAAAREAAYLRRMHLALAGGRYRAAGALLDTAFSAGGSPFAHAVFYNTITGARRAEALAALPRLGTGDIGALTRAWNAVTHGPADSAESAIRAVALATPAEATPRDSSRLAANQTGLRALLALRRGDSTGARELLREVRTAERRRLQAGFAQRPLQPAVQMSLTAAQLEFARGDYLAAKLWLADLYLLHESLVHEAPAQELMAKVCLALRDVGCAQEALRKFISLWARADSEFQPRVEAARLELARIRALP